MSFMMKVDAKHRLNSEQALDLVQEKSSESGVQPTSGPISSPGKEMQQSPYKLQIDRMLYLSKSQRNVLDTQLQNI